MEHTKTPWGAVHSVGKTLQSYSQSSCVIGENKQQMICGCFEDIGGKDVAKANAAHIVRCVNSHYAAVDIIRDIALHFDGTNSPLGEKANAFLKAL